MEEKKSDGWALSLFIVEGLKINTLHFNLHSTLERKALT